MYVSIGVNPQGVSRKDYKCETGVLFYHLFSQSAARSDSPAVCQNLGNSLLDSTFRSSKAHSNSGTILKRPKASKRGQTLVSERSKRL